LRIEELKTNLENEKKSNAKELSDAQADNKKTSQKLLTAEKENAKLLEVVKLHEVDLVKKQEKLTQYEHELKESEQIKNTIMSLMQSKSNRNK